MAASVQISASGSTVTVTITAAMGSSYNPGTASVQMVSNSSGVPTPGPTVVVTPATMTTPASATYTFSGLTSGGYTVIVTCGGETTTSVTSVQASVGVV
jgi:hypothetical protein